MRIDVVLFAAVRDAFGSSQVTVELPPGAKAADLRRRLAALFPDHESLLSSSRLACGMEFVEDDAALFEGAEIAVIPPVSGGGNGLPRVALVRDRLESASLREATAKPGIGAVVVFEGIVRSPSDGKAVLWLEYEAYEAMAAAKMEDIVNEARRSWPEAEVYLHHRLGRIEVGETSVVAVAGAPHRREAFEACRHLIERLKADVPIWKKEVFEDGSVWVGAPGVCG